MWTDINCFRLRAPDYIDRRLERSGNLALTIYLGFIHNDNQLDNITVLVEHVQRWRSLMMKAVQDSHLTAMTTCLQQLSSQYPLEELRISDPEFRWKVPTSENFDRFVETCTEKFPSLNELHIKIWNIPDPFRFPQTLAENLKVLNLERAQLSAAKIRSILLQCRSLESFRLTAGTIYDAKLEEGFPLPYLCHLSLVQHPPTAFAIFARLALPSLESLDLTFPFTSGDCVAAISVLMAPPHESLRTVHLVDFNEEDTIFGAVIDMVQSLPIATEICIQSGSAKTVRHANGLWMESPLSGKHR
jgi:hypothetical protein